MSNRLLRPMLALAAGAVGVLMAVVVNILGWAVRVHPFSFAYETISNNTAFNGKVQLALFILPL